LKFFFIFFVKRGNFCDKKGREKEKKSKIKGKFSVDIQKNSMRFRYSAIARQSMCF
jgi:hypothetical protein